MRGAVRAWLTRNDEGRPDSVHKPGDGAFRQVRRRTAAEENRVDQRASQTSPPEFDFGNQGVQIWGEEALNSLVSVEIAVGAFGLAEGDMNVQGHPGGRHDADRVFPAFGTAGVVVTRHRRHSNETLERAGGRRYSSTGREARNPGARRG